MSLPLRRFRARRCVRFINIKGSYYPVRHNKLLFFEKLILLYSVLRTAVYLGDAFFKAENFISAAGEQPVSFHCVRRVCTV